MSEQSSLVRRELVLALAGVGVGIIMLVGSDTPAAGWPVAVIAAAVAATTLAVADRLRERRHVLLLVIPFGVVDLALLLAGGIEMSRVGAGVLGMYVGWMLNRLAFGVVGEVPEPRIRRERSS